MFPSSDNNRGAIAVKSTLDSRSNLSPSTEYMIEALEICLTKNISTLARQNLIQINGIAIGAANSCSYKET